MSEYQLTEKIITHSLNEDWDTAKLEWKLIGTTWTDEPETCLCGHYPIKELCFLRNTQTGATVMIGNCCVKKFLGLSSEKMFAALRRVFNQRTRSLNPEVIHVAAEAGVLDSWELGFYLDTWRKRKLSDRQMACRVTLSNSSCGRWRRTAS
jgi:hypothetical protein